MLDTLIVLMTIAFFVLAAVYARACDLLKRKGPLQ